MTITISDCYPQYLDALLAGDKRHCHQLVKDMLNADLGVKEIYLDVFQAAMYQIGCMWEANKISVSVEHLATAIVESCIQLMYPRIFATKRTLKKSIVACPTDEYHQLGAKMIADIFEMHGWDGFFLGANVPLSDLLDMVTAKQPDVLALSLSMTFNLPDFENILIAVRKTLPDLQVLIGGQGLMTFGDDLASRYSNVAHLRSITELEEFLVAQS